MRVIDNLICILCFTTINHAGGQAKLHCLLSPEKWNRFAFSYLQCHFLKPNCPDRADSKASTYSGVSDNIWRTDWWNSFSDYRYCTIKQSTNPGNLALKFVTFLDSGAAFSSATCYACALPGRASQLASFLARFWNWNVDSKQMGMFLQQLNRNTQKLRKLPPSFPSPSQTKSAIISFWQRPILLRAT